MSYIILCKNKTAKNPYMVSDLRLKLYTLEEACLYLYQNLSLCGEELSKKSFLEWFGEELGMEELTENLMTLLRKDPKPERLASLIFDSAYFLSKAEKEVALKVIRDSEALSLWERRKKRADQFFHHGDYKKAIHDYEEMLSENKEHTQQEIHDVLYNIGCCYGSMFYYDIACQWYYHALECSEDKSDDMKAILLCKKLGLNKNEYEVFLDEHEEFKDYIEEVNMAVEEVKADWMQSEEGKLVDTLTGNKMGRTGEYYEQLERVVAGWKK